MKQYILKLKTTSTTNYALYDGTTALTDAQLTTLFTTAGSAYFTFDFDSLTPSATNAITIVNSSDTAVVTNTNLTDTIVETKDFKGTWSASATAFDTFVALSGVALDEAQLSDLMGKIKEAKEIKTAEFSSMITAWNLFGGMAAENKIFLAKNTANDTRRIYFNSSLSGNYIEFLPKASKFFLISRRRADSVNFFAFDASDGYFIYGQYAQDSSASTNPGIKRLNCATENTLTSTDNTKALSANQGRVLNNRIGDLTTLTTTAKTSAVVAINEVNAKVLTNAGAPTTSTVGTVGQLLADTTNGKLYICTDATNPYVWEEVGAGGGGIQNALIIREWS